MTKTKGEELKERIKQLEDALKYAQRFIGLAHCAGYKCRLPHCDSCNCEPEEIDWGRINPEEKIGE